MTPPLVGGYGALVVTLCYLSLSARAQDGELLPIVGMGRRGFILSGLNRRNGYANNALTILNASNPARWTVGRTVLLPHSRARNLACDPNGRVWIGLAERSII